MPVPSAKFIYTAQTILSLSEDRSAVREKTRIIDAKPVMGRATPAQVTRRSENSTHYKIGNELAMSFECGLRVGAPANFADIGPVGQQRAISVLKMAFAGQNHRCAPGVYQIQRELVLNRSTGVNECGHPRVQQQLRAIWKRKESIARRHRSFGPLARLLNSNPAGVHPILLSRP